MNPLILYFASGESLYPGAVLLILIAAGSPFLTSPRAWRARNVLAWISLLLIVMACSPFPWLAYLGLALTYGIWYSAANIKAAGAFVRRTSGAVLAALLGTLVILELPHRTLPVITGPTDDHLVVMGDSISAGLDPSVRPWPIVFEQETGVSVKNLSRAGATTTDGVGLAAGIAEKDHLVLIEIGGNDLIGDISTANFNDRLDAILKKVSARDRTVLMFELPLLPHKIGYGQAQRRLARKYNVVLIPKRYLVYVIRGSDATSDGLHLTVSGARRMADLVAKALSPMLTHQKT